MKMEMKGYVGVDPKENDECKIPEQQFREKRIRKGKMSMCRERASI